MHPRRGSTTYTPDADGNVTARGSDTFTYDQANRLKSATVTGESGTQTGTYVYNGDGNRASKTVGTTTTNYVYDVNASLPNVLTDETFKYVYGLGLAYAVDSGGNVQVYHTDGLGSVRAITGVNGNLLATYQTDEFGNPTQPPSSNSQPFQYTGQQSDTESGLYYLRARMYDPSTGRFLSRDPLFGATSDPLSLNRFIYVRDNPISGSDPGGHEGGAPCDPHQPEDGCGMSGASSGGIEPSAGGENGTAPKSAEEWVQGRLPIDGPGVDEGVGLRARATEIHDALGINTPPHNMRTTAVMRAIDPEGEVRIAVASSYYKLEDAQRMALRNGEIPVPPGPRGFDAERRLLMFAQEHGWRPVELAASRPICPDCTVRILDAGAFPVSPLKDPSILELYRGSWGTR